MRDGGGGDGLGKAVTGWAAAAMAAAPTVTAVAATGWVVARTATTAALTGWAVAGRRWGWR